MHRKGSEIELTRGNDKEIESEEVWRERLETIFQGLLRANPSCRSGVYLELEEDGGREIVRVERYEKESALVHTVPDKRLASVGDKESFREAKQLRPGEVKVVCTELNRNDQQEARYRSRQIVAAAAIHDQDNGDLFGVVLLELDLESAIGGLLPPAAPSVDAVYVTDQQGVVLLTSNASFLAQPAAPEMNITTLIPQVTEFLDPTNLAEVLTDRRSFVAQKISLDPRSGRLHRRCDRSNTIDRFELRNSTCGCRVGADFLSFLGQLYQIRRYWTVLLEHFRHPYGAAGEEASGSIRIEMALPLLDVAWSWPRVPNPVAVRVRRYGAPIMRKIVERGGTAIVCASSFPVTITPTTLP